MTHTSLLSASQLQAVICWGPHEHVFGNPGLENRWTFRSLLQHCLVRTRIQMLPTECWNVGMLYSGDFKSSKDHLVFLDSQKHLPSVTFLFPTQIKLASAPTTQKEVICFQVLGKARKTRLVASFTNSRL